MTSRGSEATWVKLAATLLPLIGLIALDAGGLAGVASTDAMTGSWTCLRRLENPDPGMGDGFGSALALRDGLLFVGAPEDDDAGVNTGAVYVFDAETLELRAKVLSPDNRPGAYFGGDLAVTDGRLIVAPDLWATGPWRTADVHVFTLPDLHLLGSVVGQAEEVRWETEVRVEAFQNTFIVSSKVVDAPTPDGPKRIRAYSAADLSFKFGLDAIENPEFTVDGHPLFGEDILIDADHIYVGQSTKTSETGALHIYEQATGAHVKTLTHPSALHFGRGLDADADTVYVGAPGVFRVHVVDRATWTERTVLEPPGDVDMEFGMNVDVIGPWLFVSNSDRDGWVFKNINPNAAVHVYDRGTLERVARLAPEEPTVGGGFGWAVAGNETRVFIAARDADGIVPNTGVVYVYAPTGGGDTCPRAVPALRRTCAEVDDFDGDGRFRNQEIARGTDPCARDTDRDGVDDGFELAFGADPLVKDTDGDTLEDGLEMQYGIDPTRADTDGDFFSDDLEIELGSDPRDPRSIPGLPRPPVRL